jgi:hypothetical protein
MYQTDPPRPPQEAMPTMYEERQRADRLAEYLRSQGINPNNLP